MTLSALPVVLLHDRRCDCGNRLSVADVAECLECVNNPIPKPVWPFVCVGGCGRPVQAYKSRCKPCCTARLKRHRKVNHDF